MRVQNLLTAVVLAGGLIGGGSAPALAAPAPTSSAACTLTVSDLYISSGEQTAFARISGGCTGFIDIVLLRADTAAGPYAEAPDTLSYLQQAADGTAATAYFTDPAEHGYCRAKASAIGLTAVSVNAVPC